MLKRCSRPIVLFITVCLLVACTSSEELLEDQKEYYRAVHIFNSMLPYMKHCPIPFVPRIVNDDATVSLLANSDRQFVLYKIASTFDSLEAKRFPDAALFSAYTYYELGEYQLAADLFKKYVALSEYREDNYVYFCRSLEKAANHLDLYLACLEWWEKDANCIEDRILFAWKALEALGKLEEAEQLALKHKDCLAYKAYLLAARSALQKGDTSLARLYIEEGKREFSADAFNLEREWSFFESF